MTRFKYYTIYRCKNCGERIRVHGKLASRLVLPPGVRMCCTLPRLQRERQVLISKYKTIESDEEPSKEKTIQQRSLTDFSKD